MTVAVNCARRNLSSTSCISSSTTICWLQKYFTENIEAIWTSSFKIRGKIQIKIFRIFIASHFANEFVSVLLCRAICFSKVRFSLAFYRRNLVFFAWIRFTLGKTQIHWFNSPPIYQSFVILFTYVLFYMVLWRLKLWSSSRLSKFDTQSSSDCLLLHWITSSISLIAWVTLRFTDVLFFFSFSNNRNFSTVSVSPPSDIIYRYSPRPTLLY